MPIEDILMRDPNLKAGRRMEKSGMLKQYAGQYVAFMNGQLVLNNPDEEEFFEELSSQYEEGEIYYCKISEHGRIKIKQIRLRSFPRITRIR